LLGRTSGGALPGLNVKLEARPIRPWSGWKLGEQSSGLIFWVDAKGTALSVQVQDIGNTNGSTHR
jgi:hypothetical protein